jgi:hypothetical protein
MEGSSNQGGEVGRKQESKQARKQASKEAGKGGGKQESMERAAIKEER